jgi:hypothetical protein
MSKYGCIKTRFIAYVYLYLDKVKSLNLRQRKYSEQNKYYSLACTKRFGMLKIYMYQQIYVRIQVNLFNARGNAEEGFHAS